MAIIFSVKRANDLFLDLNISRMHVLAKIIKADNTNINAYTGWPINLMVQLLFSEIV